MKKLFLSLGVAALSMLATGSLPAQDVTSTNTTPAMPAFTPTLSGGLQQVYDAVAGSTNFGFAAGYARGTTGNRNVAFADVPYNFNSNVGLLIGYEYLWTAKAAGIPSQANLVKGGLNLQADLKPLKQFGFTNFTVTPFGFALVASGNGTVSEIIGGGAKTTVLTWKGLNVNLGVLYENRTGAGFWNGRYVGGFAAISKGF